MAVTPSISTTLGASIITPALGFVDQPPTAPEPDPEPAPALRPAPSATSCVWPKLALNCSHQRLSLASLRKKDFAEAERIIRSLTAARIERAQVELEAFGKTTDKGVNQLQRSLSLYGYRQPMSRESRLTMRRKIKSLIGRYGVPAIWFTLNPNDITNPIKLGLAAYRTREAEEAEDFLGKLDELYKRVRLSISDPLSSALFFHREISMCFKYYVRVEEARRYRYSQHTQHTHHTGLHRVA